MVSRRAAERSVEYFGTFFAEILAMIPFGLLVFGGSALLDGHVEASVSDILIGVLVTYVLSVPLQLELKYLVHGSRPKPPYTVAAQVTGEVLGRGLAGAVGIGLLVRPTLSGAVIGLAAALVVSVATLLWASPWSPDMTEEELQAAKERFREEMDRQR